MGFVLRAAMVAAIGTMGQLVAEASFGQAGNVTPPAEGSAPAAPADDPAGAAPVLPSPPRILPRSEIAPTSGCDHSEPGTGV